MLASVQKPPESEPELDAGFEFAPDAPLRFGPQSRRREKGTPSPPPEEEFSPSPELLAAAQIERNPADAFAAPERPASRTRWAIWAALGVGAPSAIAVAAMLFSPPLPPRPAVVSGPIAILPPPAPAVTVEPRQAAPQPIETLPQDHEAAPVTPNARIAAAPPAGESEAISREASSALLPAGMPAHVLIRYATRNNEARKRAEAIAERLKSEGVEVADVRAGVSLPRTALTYFYLPDGDAARRVGQLLGLAPSRRPLANDALTVRPGLMILNLSGDLANVRQGEQQ